jgi:SAM-dependent methyltransferase
VETQADWNERWEVEPFDLDSPRDEARTLRWRAQERLVRERFGGFEGLRAIEIGSGRGLNAFLFAERGAKVTLLDNSTVALAQARELFDAHGVPVELVEADLFDLPADVRDSFDVSMSYGLCEHFLGERRLAVVRAHLEAVRPGGMALLGVPNRWSPVYRAWIWVLMRRGSWPLGTEVPFSAQELRTLAEAAGGVPLEPRYGSFAATIVNHGVNQVLYKAGRRGLPIPQVRVPLVDRMAYELLLPVVRPA